MTETRATPLECGDEALLQRAANTKLVEIDINIIRDYVKDYLFGRVVFLWDKVQLDKSGVLYNDRIRNCRGKIAEGTLLNVSEEHTMTYMDLVWSQMTQQNIYAKWLSSK
jgi:hypothetical protein